MTERQTASATEEEIDLISLARRVWQFRWVLAAVTCIAPIVVFLFIWTRPPSYEAMATVVIIPNVLAPAVGPTIPLALGSLSQEGYQQEAESEPVLSALRTKLQAAGIPQSVIDRRGALTATAHPSMPWIGLTARATDASHAQTIANAWAAALMEVDLISGEGRKQKRIDHIISGHAKAVSNLTRINGKLRATRNQHLRDTAKTELELDGDLKAAELVARQQRAFAIEDEIGRTKASPEDVSVLQRQLRDARAAVDRLRREIRSARLALSTLLAQQALEIDALNNSATDAREELQKFNATYQEAAAARDSPTSYLRPGKSATLPSAPQPKRFTRALIAVPFTLLGALVCAAFVAVVVESRKRQVMAGLERGRE